MISTQPKVRGTEEILLHLYKFNRFKDLIEAPLTITQEGMAKLKGFTQQNVSIMVKRLESQGLVYSKTTHIQGKERRQKAYFLTDMGIMETSALEKRLQSSKYIDFADQVPELKYFFGRKEEIAEFNRWLKSDTYKVLVVRGMAGIGKTSYIIKAIQPARPLMHTFWHRFSEWSTLRSMITRLGDFLWEIGKNTLNLNIRAKETIDINDIAAILERDLMGLNVLLIFDNYQKIMKDESLTHMFGAFMRILENVDGAKLVVLGREVPRFFYDERQVAIKKVVKEINLEGLDRESSLSFLENRNILRSDGESLYEIVGGHPLSMELIRNPGNLGNQDELMRFVEDEIFSHLTPRERELLEIASVFRYPIYISAYLDIAGGYHMEQTEDKDGFSPLGYEVIDSLIKKSLINVSEGVGDVHDLLKEFFNTRLPEHVKRMTHEKIASYYLENISGTHQARLEAYYHLLMADKQQQVAEYLIEDGNSLIHGGYWQETLVVVEKIQFENIAPNLKPKLLLLKGKFLDISGELDRSIECFRRTIDNAEAIGDDENTMRAHLGIGKILITKNRYDEALVMISKTIKKAEEAGDLITLEFAYNGMGLALQKKGELDKALEAYEKALEYSQKAGDVTHYPFIQQNLGNTLSDMGEHEKALNYLKKSLSSFVEMDNVQEIARSYINLGGHIFHTGREVEALELYEKALSLSEEISHLRLTGYALSGYAADLCEADTIPNEEKDFDKALRYTERALKIFFKIEEEEMIIICHWTLGLIYLKMNEQDKSDEYYRIAMERAEGFSMERFAESYIRFSKALLESGRIDEAEELLIKALSVCKKHGLDNRVKQVQEMLEKLGTEEMN